MHIIQKSNSDKKSTYLYLAILACFILQILIVYIPELQLIFRTTSIGITDWILIFIIAATILVSNKNSKQNCGRMKKLNILLIGGTKDASNITKHIKRKI